MPSNASAVNEGCAGVAIDKRHEDIARQCTDNEKSLQGQDAEQHRTMPEKMQGVTKRAVRVRHKVIVIEFECNFKREKKNIGARRVLQTRGTWAVPGNPRAIHM